MDISDTSTFKSQDSIATTETVTETVTVTEEHYLEKSTQSNECEIAKGLALPQSMFDNHDGCADRQMFPGCAQAGKRGLPAGCLFVARYTL